MNESNKQEVPVLSDEWVRTRIKAGQAALNMPASYMDILPGHFKGFYERIVSDDGYRLRGYEVELDSINMSTVFIRKWLDAVDILANELGVDPIIQGNDYGTIEAYFSKRVPYTKQEKEYAQHILDNREYIELENGVIRWRKPVPFSGLDSKD